MSPQTNDSSAHLEKPMTVVGIKGWAFLASSLLFVFASLAWAFLGTIPVAVTGKCLFLDTEKLEIYGFVPFIAGQYVEPGMAVECSLDGVREGRSGLLHGTVQQVLPFPVDEEEAHMQQIPSSTLRSYLLQSATPLTLVIVAPKPDLKSYSGFAWTSKKDPEIHLHSGMTGTISIVLEEVKPISYVIPTMAKR